MSTACQPRPAKHSPPDERDLRIFKLAEIHRWTHDKIASELGDITRRRVSQIVQDVRIWLATHPADDPALATEIERQRLARNMGRLRLEDIIERAVHGLDTAPTVLKTTRSTDGGPTTRTLRDQPPVDVRLLKTYLRAVTALGKLNERPALPEPQKEAQQPWSHPKIQEVVKAWQLDTHNYLVTDECLATFAEDLTVAFLDCFGRPPSPADQAPASAGASQVSQAEAHDEPGSAVPANEATLGHNETSDDDATPESASPAAETSREKLKKGSADTPAAANHEQPAPELQYAKRMLIGQLPPNHPALRNRSVTKRQINSQHPGVTISGPTAPDPQAPPAEPQPSDHERRDMELDLQGLDDIEKRLDTLLAQTPDKDREKRDSLEQSLTLVRGQKADIELRLSPHTPGVAINDSAINPYKPLQNPQTTRS